MTEIPQHPHTQELSSIPTAVESQLPSHEENQGVPRSDVKAIRKATGPRTVQGKKRSKLNALKYGLLSKAVLLRDESRTEYDALLNGLIDDLQPQGKLETVLVENLATVLWRRRRLLQAETAEIEKSNLLNLDLVLQNKAGQLEYAQLGASSGVKPGESNLRDRLRDAIEILHLHLQFLAADDSERVESMRRALTMMFGVEKEGPFPIGWRQMSLMLSKLITDIMSQRHLSEDELAAKEPDAKGLVLEAVGQEIMRLVGLYDLAVKVERLKCDHNAAERRIPSPGASEHLMRYEAHLSREADRILNRLERLQRMRKGQQLPPQLDIKIT